MEAIAVGSLLASGASSIAGAGTVIGAGVTLGQVATGFSVLGGAMNFFAGQDQADAAYDATIAASRASLDATRARVAEGDLNAQRQRTQAAIEEAERQRRLRRALASQRAAFAGGSADINSGSFNAIQDDTIGEINRESRLADLATEDAVNAINTNTLGVQAAGFGQASSLIGQANTNRTIATQTGLNQLTQTVSNVGRIGNTVKT